MYNSIITSSCLFGSVYIFSKSLINLNNAFLEEKTNKKIIIMNGLTFLLSGSVFIYSINHGINLLRNNRYIK